MALGHQLSLPLPLFPSAPPTPDCVQFLPSLPLCHMLVSVTSTYTDKSVVQQLSSPPHPLDLGQFGQFFISAAQVLSPPLDLGHFGQFGQLCQFFTSAAKVLSPLLNLGQFG